MERYALFAARVLNSIFFLLGLSWADGSRCCTGPRRLPDDKYELYRIRRAQEDGRVQQEGQGGSISYCVKNVSGMTTKYFMERSLPSQRSTAGAESSSSSPARVESIHILALAGASPYRNQNPSTCIHVCSQGNKP